MPWERVGLHHTALPFFLTARRERRLAGRAGGTIVARALAALDQTMADEPDADAAAGHGDAPGGGGGDTAGDRLAAAAAGVGRLRGAWLRRVVRHWGFMWGAHAVVVATVAVSLVNTREREVCVRARVRACVCVQVCVWVRVGVRVRVLHLRGPPRVYNSMAQKRTRAEAAAALRRAGLIVLRDR